MVVVGFASALVIYLFAQAAPYDPLLDDPLGRKKYAHEMRVMGGSLNLLMADLQDWFEAQWQDKELARSVALLTIATVLSFRFMASLPRGDRGPKSKPPGEPGAPKA
ncbi:MAG: hypothetical protein JWM32_2940 [Verrucomicrobia bacterium]|nr:hypothetical protein [Verrucomicrobiota bacterium]